MMNSNPAFFFAIVLALAVSACSFTKSSDSSSDSGKSSVDSSESSSGSLLSPFDLSATSLGSSSRSSETEEQTYKREVRDYTAEFARASRGSLNDFRSRLSDLAKRHGITDWEADELTLEAVGRGLRKADLGRPQFEAFRDSLSGSDLRKRKAIEKGYRD